jgi:hypothetical protein
MSWRYVGGPFHPETVRSCGGLAQLLLMLLLSLLPSWLTLLLLRLLLLRLALID